MFRIKIHDAIVITHCINMAVLDMFKREVKLILTYVGLPVNKPIFIKKVNFITYSFNRY